MDRARERVKIYRFRYSACRGTCACFQPQGWHRTPFPARTNQRNNPNPTTPAYFGRELEFDDLHRLRRELQQRTAVRLLLRFGPTQHQIIQQALFGSVSVFHDIKKKAFQFNYQIGQAKGRDGDEYP